MICRHKLRGFALTKVPAKVQHHTQEGVGRWFDGTAGSKALRGSGILLGTGLLLLPMLPWVRLWLLTRITHKTLANSSSHGSQLVCHHTAAADQTVGDTQMFPLLPPAPCEVVSLLHQVGQITAIQNFQHKQMRLPTNKSDYCTGPSICVAPILTAFFREQAFDGWLSDNLPSLHECFGGRFLRGEAGLRSSCSATKPTTYNTCKINPSLNVRGLLGLIFKVSRRVAHSSSR